MRKFYFALLFVGLTILAAAPSAHATCSGSGCNGLPPAGNCDDGFWVTATPLNVGGSTIGHVHLMWSPSCDTFWSRVATLGSYGAGPTTLSDKTFWAYLSGNLNFGYSAGTPAALSSPSFFDVINTDYSLVRDSAMYHRLYVRFSSGARACGRITGVITDRCTTTIDPNDPFFTE